MTLVRGLKRAVVAGDRVAKARQVANWRRAHAPAVRGLIELAEDASLDSESWGRSSAGERSSTNARGMIRQPGGTGRARQAREAAGAIPTGRTMVGAARQLVSMCTPSKTLPQQFR